MRKKVKFGIIGCGTIAGFHANALYELSGKAELVGVTGASYESALTFAKKHGVKAFSSIAEMLASPEIDVVNICTPSGVHAEQIIQAARAGKHIIVEKPMAITREQLDEVVRACEESHIILSSIAQSRFSNDVQMVRKAMDDGLLGKLLYADVSMKYNRTQAYYDSASWRGTWAMDGGGALMNQGVHGVDLMLYLAGPIKSVQALAKTRMRSIEVEDTLTALVEYENGAIGTIQAATSVSPGAPRRVELNGENGTIELRESSISRWEVLNDACQDIVIQPALTGSFATPTAITLDGHVKQINDVIQSIRTGKKPLIDVYEGRKPVDVILAIYQSAREGKTIYLNE